MAKKDKIPLTPEQIAEKKLNSRKKRARVLAVVLAIVITACVYFAGSKEGPKTVRVEPQAVVVDNVVERVVEKEVTVTVTVPAPATEAPTTEAPTTAAPPATEAPSDSSDGSSDILGTITGLLGGITDGLGDVDIGGLGGGVDTSGVADAIEGIGSSAQDFFNGIADKVGTTEAAQ